MAIDIYEESKLLLRARFTGGKPKSDKCQFVLTRDGAEWQKQDAAVEDSEAKLEIEKLAKVDDDKPSYRLEYKVVCGDEEKAGADAYVVWPAKATLKTTDKDGKAIGGAPFTLKQGATSKDFETQASGELACDLAKAAFDGFEIKKPWALLSWTKETGRAREAKVERRFVAEFLKPKPPADGKPTKQYVNLATTDKGRDGKGSKLTLEVGAKDAAGRKDDVIFVQAEFSRESKRDTPKPALSGVEGLAESDAGKTWKGKVKLGDKGAAASFDLELGLAGGELCTVKIGATDACGDATLQFGNWRKLKHATWQPTNSGDDRCTDYTKFGADPGLSADSKSYFAETLGKVFIEWDDSKAEYFAKADLPAAGAHNVIDADYVEKDAGKKVVVVTDPQADAIRIAKAGALESDKLTVTTLLVDHIAFAASWTQSFTELGRPLERATTVRVFKKAISADLTFAHGAFPIKELKWRATHYQDGALWKPIAAAGDPGFADKGWSAITAEAKIRAHVDFVNWGKVGFKLPADDASYPGAKLPVDGDGDLTGANAAGDRKKVRIELYVTGVGATFGVNALALQGTINLNTHGGAVHSVGMGRTLLHELGHNMGQSYVKKLEDGSAGDNFARAAATKVPGLDFPDRVATGFVYVGHGHTGNHCAFGLSDANRATDPFDAAGFAERKCILFGSGDMSLSDKYEFCEHCTKHIRAENLSDIRRTWTG